MVDRLADQFSWTIENNEAFQKKLDELGDAIKDFRPPFRAISSDFYRSQRQLFTLQGAGKYVDLTENYKKQKKKEVGFIYPILVGATRDLSNSTLGKDHRNSIFHLGKQSLEIGTNIPYGKFHQSDKPRKKIPQRKFVFITGGDGDRSKDSGINGRRERWTFIIDTHIKQIISGEI